MIPGQKTGITWKLLGFPDAPPEPCPSPLRGRICFPSFGIWPGLSGHLYCWEYSWSDIAQILRLAQKRKIRLWTFSFCCCLSVSSALEPIYHTVRKPKLVHIKSSWGPQPTAGINLQTCEWRSLQVTAVPSLWVFQPKTHPLWAETNSAGKCPHSWPYKTSDHHKWLIGAMKFGGNLSPTTVAIVYILALQDSYPFHKQNIFISSQHIQKSHPTKA